MVRGVVQAGVGEVVEEDEAQTQYTGGRNDNTPGGRTPTTPGCQVQGEGHPHGCGGTCFSGITKNKYDPIIAPVFCEPP